MHCMLHGHTLESLASPLYLDGQEQPLTAQDQMVLEGDPAAVTSVQSLKSMAAVEPEKI